MGSGEEKESDMQQAQEQNIYWYGVVPALTEEDRELIESYGFVSSDTFMQDK